ncbi:MAG: helix-turn-helix domain-containing protein, partial [Bacteroidaceae bacterium]
PKPFDTNQMYAIIRSQLGGRFEIKRQYNFRFFDKMSPDQTFSFTDEQFITSLNSLIDKNVSNPKLTDGMILQEMGISESVMHRKMNGLLATNLTVYLNRIRIGLVKDKLANTDHDLETIAAETGFTSAADMDKAFSRETGKSVFSARGE